MFYHSYTCRLCIICIWYCMLSQIRLQLSDLKLKDILRIMTFPVPPRIIEDPQTKYRVIGDDVKLCCKAGPTSSSLSYKW